MARRAAALLALVHASPLAAADHAWTGTRSIELAPSEPARLSLLLAGMAFGAILLVAWTLWRRRATFSSPR